MKIWQKIDKYEIFHCTIISGPLWVQNPTVASSDNRCISQSAHVCCQFAMIFPNTDLSTYRQTLNCLFCVFFMFFSVRLLHFWSFLRGLTSANLIWRNMYTEEKPTGKGGSVQGQSHVEQDISEGDLSASCRGGSRGGGQGALAPAPAEKVPPTLEAIHTTFCGCILRQRAHRVKKPQFWVLATPHEKSWVRPWAVAQFWISKLLGFRKWSIQRGPDCFHDGLSYKPLILVWLMIMWGWVIISENHINS